MLTPMLVLILTAIAGPANTMLRYVYPVILSAPIYVIMAGYIISEKSKVIENTITTDNNKKATKDTNSNKTAADNTVQNK